jgi:hypothetical protein
MADPDTFRQTLRYVGWPGVFVRCDSANRERMRAIIERSRNWSAVRPKVRLRKTT